jgi:hypothetical protein
LTSAHARTKWTCRTADTMRRARLLDRAPCTAWGVQRVGDEWVNEQKASAKTLSSWGTKDTYNVNGKGVWFTQDMFQVSTMISLPQTDGASSTPQLTEAPLDKLGLSIQPESTAVTDRTRELTHAHTTHARGPHSGTLPGVQGFSLSRRSPGQKRARVLLPQLPQRQHLRSLYVPENGR